MNLGLEGRTALVTGASSDVGAAVARLLASQGAGLRLSGRRRERLDQLAAELAPLGHPIEVVAGDLQATGTLEALVPEGREPDVFVHVAGHRFRYARLHNVSEEDLAATRAVDCDVFTSLCRRALPAMMGRRFGRVIAVTSLSSQLAGSGTAPYALAKAAVEGLVRALAVDYGRYGITANVVAPGFIETERMTERLAEGGAGRRSELERATSLKRFARPEEIAAPVAFLCAPAASYVTGATLLVTGGLHLNNLW